MSSNRGTIRVTKGAWHLRPYDWYIEQNPWVAKEQEDLCHYFWTNARAVNQWFLHVGLVFGLAPVWFVIALAAIASLAYSYTQWPTLTLTAVLLLGLATVMLRCIFLFRKLKGWMSDHYPWSLTTFKWLTSPVWLPFWLIYQGLSKANQYCEWHFNHGLVGSFFLVHRFWVITPFTVTFAGVCALLVLQFGFETVWAIIVILFRELAPTALTIVITSLLLATVMIFFSYLKERITDWNYNRQVAKRRAGQLADQSGLPVKQKIVGTSSYRMIFTYLKAIKHRFCPYIEIVRD